MKKNLFHILTSVPLRDILLSPHLFISVAIFLLTTIEINSNVYHCGNKLFLRSCFFTVVTKKLPWIHLFENICAYSTELQPRIKNLYFFYYIVAVYARYSKLCSTSNSTNVKSCDFKIMNCVHLLKCLED